VESDIIMLTELTLTRLGTLNHKRIAKDIAPRSNLIQLHPLREQTHDMRRFQKGGSCTWIQPTFAARVSKTQPLAPSQPEKKDPFSQHDMNSQHTQGEHSSMPSPFLYRVKNKRKPNPPVHGCQHSMGPRRHQGFKSSHWPQESNGNRKPEHLPPSCNL